MQTQIKHTAQHQIPVTETQTAANTIELTDQTRMLGWVQRPIPVMESQTVVGFNFLYKINLLHIFFCVMVSTERLTQLIQGFGYMG